MAAEPDIDRDVRVALFERLAAGGEPPTRAEVAAAAGLTAADVAASYRRLAEAHVLVLDPGTGELWMANPFSAVETPFRVEVGSREYHGNCIWDALGIVAMLGGIGTARFPCADCREPLMIEVRDGRPVTGRDLLVHFAVPAAHWWDDIGFT